MMQIFEPYLAEIQKDEVKYNKSKALDDSTKTATNFDTLIFW